jgi:hypothetical protein
MTEWQERECGNCTHTKPDPRDYYATRYWAEAHGDYECAHCGAAIGVLDPEAAAERGDLPLCPRCEKVALKTGLCSRCWGSADAVLGPVVSHPLSSCLRPLTLELGRCGGNKNMLSSTS